MCVAFAPQSLLQLLYEAPSFCTGKRSSSLDAQTSSVWTAVQTPTRERRVSVARALSRSRKPLLLGCSRDGHVSVARVRVARVSVARVSVARVSNAGASLTLSPAPQSILLLLYEAPSFRTEKRLSYLDALTSSVWTAVQISCVRDASASLTRGPDASLTRGRRSRSLSLHKASAELLLQLYETPSFCTAKIQSILPG